MRAVVPSGTEALVRLAEVDEPSAGTGDAVIEVAAFSVNRGETFLLREPRPGWRPGKDVAGTVAVAAADGSGPAVGTRVVAHPESHGWAERVAVPTSRLAALPDGVTYVPAATLPLAGLTALRLDRVAGDAGAGSSLVTGASGGVGHVLVELLAARGGKVTAVTSSPERGERLLELGAAEVVRAVAEAPGPFDVAFEAVGGATFTAARQRLTSHGLLLWYGQAGGEPPVLDFVDWSGADSGTIRRFHHEGDGEPVDADLAVLVSLVASGGLRPEVELVDDWSGTAAAIGELLARRVRGNAVLTVR